MTDEAARVRTLVPHHPPPAFEAILEHAPLVVCRDDGTLLWASAPGASMLGPGPHATLLDVVVERDRDRVAQELARLSTETRTPRRTEFGLQQRDGSRVHVEADVTSIETDDRPALVLCLHDVTARQELERELYHRALHDPLTGLPNRALLEDRLEQAVARLRRAVADEALVVLYVDVDRFKTVNDTHGHEAGDRVIREVARRLLHGVRPGDTVARIGGDEFVIVCPDTSSTLLDDMGERLHRAINEPIELPSATLRVTASIGVAVAHTPNASPAELVRAADAAMYRAKRAGRGRMALGYPGE